MKLSDRDLLGGESTQPLCRLAKGRDCAVMTYLDQDRGYESGSFICLQEPMVKMSSPSPTARINAPVEQVGAVSRGMAQASC